MKKKEHWTASLPKYIVIGFLGAGILGMGVSSFWSDKTEATLAVNVPEFTPVAEAGQPLFEANCAACHGNNGAGSENGPPLVHDIYNPGHHPDEAFYAAVRQGVPRHHWPYGNMPKQPQVSTEEVAKIVQYVRELQMANGIVYRQHNM